MKKFFKNSILLSVSALILSSCAGEDFDDKDADVVNQKMLTYIETTDLVGNWDLSVMQANTAVDLNGDGYSNTNLLEETTCFDIMDIHLKEDMTFTSVNSRMDFQAGETNDRFECRNNWKILLKMVRELFCFSCILQGNYLKSGSSSSALII